MEPPIPKCCNIGLEPCKFRDKTFGRCLMFAKMLSIDPKLIKPEDKPIFPIEELNVMLQSKVKTLLNVNSEVIMIKALAQVIISEYTKCVIQVTREIEMAGVEGVI
jgi:hypothetical protein